MALTEEQKALIEPWPHHQVPQVHVRTYVLPGAPTHTHAETHSRACRRPVCLHTTVSSGGHGAGKTSLGSIKAEGIAAAGGASCMHIAGERCRAIYVQSTVDTKCRVWKSACVGKKTIFALVFRSPPLRFRLDAKCAAAKLHCCSRLSSRTCRSLRLRQKLRGMEQWKLRGMEQCPQKARRQRTSQL